MRLNAAAVVGDAWRLFRRDRDLLLRVAGPFWFVPAFALALLIPAPPPRPAGSARDATATLAWADDFAQWMTAQGPWYVLAWAIGALASATLFCWYLDGETTDLRDALRRGARAWPRLMLVNAIVAVMAGAGLLLWIVPGLYVLGRMLPAAPALVAERPSAAVLAIGRAFWLSRGAGLSLMALIAATLGLGWVGSEPLLLLEGWLRTRPGGENVVAIALCDAVAAGVATAAALAGVLIAVAAYRRLASKGI